MLEKILGIQRVTLKEMREIALKHPKDKFYTKVDDPNCATYLIHNGKIYHLPLFYPGPHQDYYDGAYLAYRCDIFIKDGLNTRHKVEMFLKAEFNTAAIEDWWPEIEKYNLWAMFQ